MQHSLKGEGAAITPGIPIKPETISRWGDDLESAWKKNCPCYVAPKYDGWQIQIHLLPEKVMLFSRRILKDVTADFPHVARATRLQINAHTAILDTEVVPYDPENGRLLASTHMRKSLFHKVFVFEILYLNGEDWTVIPYEKHVDRINDIVKLMPEGVFEPRKSILATNFATLESLYRQCIDDKLEGVIIKRPYATYKSGRRTSEKGKIKKWESLDVVILHCNLTNDNRIKMVKVGMRKSEGEHEFTQVGTVDNIDKVDFELNTYLLSQLKPKQLDFFGEIPKGSFEVVPDIVIEVKTLLKYIDTNIKGACLLLENPQFVRIREDKGPDEADTIEEFM